MGRCLVKAQQLSAVEQQRQEESVGAQLFVLQEN